MGTKAIPRENVLTNDKYKGYTMNRLHSSPSSSSFFSAYLGEPTKEDFKKSFDSLIRKDDTGLLNRLGSTDQYVKDNATVETYHRMNGRRDNSGKTRYSWQNLVRWAIGGS